MAKRGRKPKASPLALLVHERLDALGIPSVTALEERAGLPADGFRDIMRGKVGRNKAVKLAVIERVGSILRIPPAELAALAGIVKIDGKRVDLGTPEMQMRRQTLAAGGDPRLCHSALGVLLAHQEVAGRLGVDQNLHDTGEKFAALITKPMPGAPRAPRSILKMMAYPGGGGDPDEEAMEMRTDAARLAWQALQAADVAAARAFLSPRPSALVWAVAVRSELPAWAAPLAEGPWPPAALAEWAALRWGLRTLRRHFGRNEDHRAVVMALKDRGEAARYGDVAHHLPAAERMLARRGRLRGQ